MSTKPKRKAPREWYLVAWRDTHVALAPHEYLSDAVSMAGGGWRILKVREVLPKPKRKARSK